MPFLTNTLQPRIEGVIDDKAVLELLKIVTEVIRQAEGYRKQSGAPLREVEFVPTGLLMMRAELMQRWIVQIVCFEKRIKTA